MSGIVKNRLKFDSCKLSSCTPFSNALFCWPKRINRDNTCAVAIEVKSWPVVSSPYKIRTQKYEPIGKVAENADHPINIMKFRIFIFSMVKSFKNNRSCKHTRISSEMILILNSTIKDRVQYRDDTEIALILVIIVLSL